MTVAAEPILIGLLVTITTGSVGWIGLMMHTALGKVGILEDKAQRMEIAVFGDPEDPVPNGVRRDVATIRTQLTEHVEEEREVWIKLTTSFTEQKATFERLFSLLDLNGRAQKRHP